MSHWSKRYEKIHSLSDISLISCQSVEHLRRALRVTDVGDLGFSSLLKDEIDLSWKIVLAQVTEAVVEVLLGVQCLT
jgi:hypothetical protein